MNVKTIDAAKVWNGEIIYYYIKEGHQSAEQFCKDVIVPALKEDQQELTIDFSNFKFGVSIQQVWIMAYYLIEKAKFTLDELQSRLIIKEDELIKGRSLNDEFRLAILDASKN